MGCLTILRIWVWWKRPVNTPPLWGIWGMGTVTTSERTEMAGFLWHLLAETQCQTFFTRIGMGVGRNGQVLTENFLMVIVVIVVVAVVVTVIIAIIMGAVTS